MENRHISSFCRRIYPAAQDSYSMAAIYDLFPQLSHCIAAATGTDNRQKITLMNREIYIMKRGGFSLHCMVGIAHVLDFH